MSVNTFTLNVGEGSSIDVSYAQVVDSTNSNIKRLYIASVRLRSTLQQTSPARLFRLLITQPSSPPAGWDSTGAVATLLFSARSNFAPPQGVATTSPYDGTYTFAPNVVSLIGTQTIQPQDVNVPCIVTLQTSVDNANSWQNVAFTGTGTPYTFDIGDGTNRQYQTIDVDRSNTIIKNDGATLYFCQNYNAIYTPALTSGSSTVIIAGDTYVAYADTGGLIPNASTSAGNGNDFAIYVPNSANNDGSPTLVEDRQMQIIATLEANLLDLGLTTSGLLGAPATIGSITKTVERNDSIAFYALTDWTQVTVDSIEETPNSKTLVNDTSTPIYYNTFSYQGTTYTLTIVNGLGGKKNIKMEAVSSPGSTVSTTIYRIWIRPGTPSGGTKVL